MRTPGRQEKEDLVLTFERGELDSRSHVFSAQHDGKTIVSFRATLLADGDTTEHGRYMQYPVDFPKLSDCVETTQPFVDPRFRAEGVLAPMFGPLVGFALEKDRRYVYGGAAGHLIDVYKRFGARTIGLPYRNSALGGIEQRLFILDAAELALGQGVSEDIWLRAYSDISVCF